MGYACREGKLEKRRQEGPIRRGHCETAFYLNFDLKLCLDSTASRPRSEAVSLRDLLKSVQGKPYLLTRRGLGADWTGFQPRDRITGKYKHVALMASASRLNVHEGPPGREGKLMGGWARGDVTVRSSPVIAAMLECMSILQETYQVLLMDIGCCLVVISLSTHYFQFCSIYVSKAVTVFRVSDVLVGPGNA